MEHIKTDKILSLAWKTAYMFVNWFAELVHDLYIGGFSLFL